MDATLNLDYSCECELYDSLECHSVMDSEADNADLLDLLNEYDMGELV